MTDSESSVPSEEIIKSEEIMIYESFHNLKKSQNVYNDFKIFEKEGKLNKLIGFYSKYKEKEIKNIHNDFISLIRDFKMDNTISLGYKQEKLFGLTKYISNFLELDTEKIVERLLKSNVLKGSDYDSIYLEEFIVHCISTLHCHTFLKKHQTLIELYISLRNGTKKISNSIIDRYLIISASSGTGPGFRFWVDNFFKDSPSSSYLTVSENIFVGYNSDKMRKPLICFAAGNSDDRIFKFLVKKISETKSQSELLGNVKRMELLISNIFSRHIDTKYSLKRLKHLCDNNFNLNFFSGFIMSCSRSIIEFKKLSKFYYKDNIKINFSRLCTHIIREYEKNGISVINDFMNLLNADEERFNLMIDIITSYCCCFEFNFKFDKYFDIDCKRILNIIVNIKYKFSYDDESENCYSCNMLKKECFKNNLKYLKKATCFNKVLNEYFSKVKKTYENNLGIHTMSKILLLNSRFLVLDDKKVKNEYFLNMNHRFNKMLHIFRIKAKNIYKRRKTIEKAKQMLTLINKKRNDTKLINKFTMVPPRSLIPEDIDNLRLKKTLIKEKADGVLVNILPLDIYPAPTTKIMESKLKAEYIEIGENIGLYLIFDIEMEGDVLERYNYLRSSHSEVNSKMETIKDWKDFQTKLQEERSNINKFLDNFTEKDEFINLWYPKACWIVEEKNDLIWDQMVNHLVLEKTEISNLVCEDGVYKCDGLIVDHFDQQQEIKIKPIRLHTVDLMYSGNNWIDRDNCIWDVESNEVQQDSIWRCYLINDKWVAKERRFDKFRANPNKIAKSIETLAKTNWEKSYYHKRKAKEEIQSFIPFFRKQENFLRNFLSLMNVQKNKNWMDLGCGNGKLIRHIMKYRPKQYFGLDNDVSCLSKISRMKTRNVWINYLEIDLNKEWNKLMDLKFDYIVANFSLTHYYSNEFWNKLNQYSKSGSYFLCNFLNDKSKDGYNNNNCSIEVNGDTTTLFFPWCHKEKINEKFIEEKKFLDEALKSNWKVYQKSIPFTSGLESYYSWYILTKI